MDSPVLDEKVPHSTTSSKPKRFRFLLHSFFATGHVLPMQAVARALVDRGHEVVWLTHPTQERRVQASGARFVATQEIAGADAALQGATPIDVAGAISALFGGRMVAQAADLRRVLTAFSADCLLNDALPQGAAAVYELGEVPFYATLGVVPLYLPYEHPLQPTISPLYPASKGPPPRTTSTLGHLLSDPQILLPCFNAQRAELGLKPLEPSLTPLHYSPFLHIQASCPLLEFEESTAWPQQDSQQQQPQPQQQSLVTPNYVGPLVAPVDSSDSSRPSWWTDLDDSDHRGSVVIGVTQGTYAVDPNLLILPAIEALAGNPSVLLVVASPQVELIRKSLSSAANNVRLAAWIPYELLLPRCHLLLTNGGYGSVTQALSHAVPVLTAGTTEDKKDTAARVTWVGAGIDLGTERPSPALIREAVAKILDDSSYRENASRVAKQLHGLGGADKACDLLEEAVFRFNRTS